MKVLALILTLYFFAVSVVPCPDSCVEPVTANPVHSTPDTDDDCSTLCVCTCCGIVFDVAHSLINLDSPFIQPQLFIFPDRHPLNNTASNIWQPPKTA